MMTYSHLMIRRGLFSLWMTATILLLWTNAARAQAPANDNFADRIVLSGTVSGSDAGATGESGEPRHDGAYSFSSVWYSWTAPATGTAIVNCTKNFSGGNVAVYTGTAVDALTGVGADSFWGNWCWLKIPVEEGTTYQIAVNGAGTGTFQLWANMAATITVSSPNGACKVDGGGIAGLNTIHTVHAYQVDGYLFSSWTESGTTVSTSGTYQFTVTGDRNLVANYVPVPAPDNDNFANRAVLSGTSPRVDNSNATREPGEPDHGSAPGGGGKSVWWTWTAPVSGTATLGIKGTLDSAVSVYTGHWLNWLSRQASMTNPYFIEQYMQFNVSKGEAYQIAVDSYWGFGGSFQLHILPPPGPQLQIPSENGFAVKQKISVPVQLLATGDENALAFSVKFDPSKLRFKSLSLDPSQSGVTLTVDKSQTAQGHIGVTLAKGGGVTFSAGIQTLVSLSFDPVKADDDISLGFGDEPVARVVTGTDSAAIDSTYSDGALKIRKYADISLASEPVGGKVEGLGTFLVGSTRTLRAKAAPGSIFAGWEDGETSPIRKVKVSVDGLAVEANFNPSPALWKGSYTGRLDANVASLITVTTDRYNNFTGAIRVYGQTYRFHGKLDVNGNYDGMLASPAGWEVTLSMNASDGSFYGNLIQGGNSMGFALNYSMRDAKVDGSGVKGKYTFLLDRSPYDDSAPTTRGFGTLNVSKTGLVRIAGKLGDGTAFSQSGEIDEQNTLRMYVPLYSGAGYLSGDMTFEYTDGSDVDGVLNWYMPPRSANSLYPSGVSTQAYLQGCFFTPTSTFSKDFLGKMISFPYILFDALSVAKGNNQLGTVLNFLYNESAYIRINPSTGVLSGNLFNGYTDPVTGEPANSPLQGVILQRLGIGGGFFFNGDSNAVFDVN